VIRTLHGYLSKDLARVATLALLGFTMVMTVFAIMEPMRKQGLSTAEVLRLFGLTVPVMLSLTLPVAALFAATIVYGRFAQENELLAARASGISTISLLRPALALGVLVTAASVVLSNYVAPKMAEYGARLVQSDIRHIVAHQLRTRSYFRIENLLIRADGVHDDGRLLRLSGVVVADRKDPKEPQLLVATTAYVEFYHYLAQDFAAISLINPGVILVGRPGIEKGGSVELVWPIESPVEEKPSFYDWDRLNQTLANPTQHTEVKRSLDEIKRSLRHHRVSEDVVRVLTSGQPYEKLVRNGVVYRISAPAAQVDAKGAAWLTSDVAADGTVRRVEVAIEGPDRKEIITADEGFVRTSWSYGLRKSFVTIEMKGNVMARLAEEAPAAARRRDDWQQVQLPVPPQIEAWAESITFGDLARPQQLTANPEILAKIRWLKDEKIQKVVGDIRAEKHVRIAYSFSCFLLVAMGAALGIVFRGGQVIVAFAISMVPAGMVIVMILMGKEMISNPDVPEIRGVAAVWGGVSALLLANVAMYVRLLRR
jgi:lipopolysaccharide export LptBFGC system permease protein LptF/translation initiation factor 1 (eIF-1/SUI1)